MPPDATTDRPRNLLLVILLFIATLFTARHEGYLPLISPAFWLVLLAGFGIAAWLACWIAPTRLLSLMLIITIMEYIKESIGVSSGMWTYQGVKGAYIFGVWAWVLAGLAAYALATRIVIPLVRKLNLAVTREGNQLIVGALFLLILLSLGKYWSGAGLWFWCFYAALLGAGVYIARRMDYPVLAGIIITAIISGNLSEYAGSVPSHIWTFPHNPHYPPLFLVAGCWPLEILAQYALSAFLANEPLDKDTH